MEMSVFTYQQHKYARPEIYVVVYMVVLTFEIFIFEARTIAMGTLRDICRPGTINSIIINLVKIISILEKCIPKIFKNRFGVSLVNKNQ